MKMARIDETRCAGCGICAGVCPQGIEMKNGKAAIKDQKAVCLKDAAVSCPGGAIILGEEESTGSGGSQPGRYGPDQGRGTGAGRGRGLGRGPRDGRGRGLGGGGRGRW